MRRAADGEGFEVEVVPVGEDGGEAPTILRPRYVVWAAGEFQYPRVAADYFPGSELCVHNSSVRSWKELAGDDFVVIGGYESGMASHHLVFEPFGLKPIWFAPLADHSEAPLTASGCRWWLARVVASLVTLDPSAQ